MQIGTDWRGSNHIGEIWEGALRKDKDARNIRCHHLSSDIAFTVKLFAHKLHMIKIWTFSLDISIVVELSRVASHLVLVTMFFPCRVKTVMNSDRKMYHYRSLSWQTHSGFATVDCSCKLSIPFPLKIHSEKHVIAEVLSCWCELWNFDLTSAKSSLIDPTWWKF